MNDPKNLETHLKELDELAEMGYEYYPISNIDEWLRHCEPPYMATLTEHGFQKEGIDNPNKCIFRVMTVPYNNIFKSFFVIKFKETENKNDPFYIGRMLWESAMQRQIANFLHIFTDDPDSGLFVGACFNNARDHLFLVGKLDEFDHILTRVGLSKSIAYNKLFQRFMQ
jgi:hypothetical protein